MAKDNIGTVLKVQGEVTIERYAQSLTAQRNPPLFLGDQIVTQDNELIEFRLNDGSIITVAANSNFSITK